MGRRVTWLVRGPQCCNRISLAHLAGVPVWVKKDIRKTQVSISPSSRPGCSGARSMSLAQVLAAKQAASVIPIVFATVGDPVGSGLVAKLAKPGGNVTGLATPVADLAGKRLEFCARLFPVSPVWGSWAMSATHLLYWSWPRFDHDLPKVTFALSDCRTICNIEAIV